MAGHELNNFIGTKESFYIGNRLTPTGLLPTPTWPLRFIVLKHQFGGRVLLTLYKYTFTSLVCHGVGQGGSFTTPALEVEFCSFAAHLHALASPPVTPATAAPACVGLYFCGTT